MLVSSGTRLPVLLEDMTQPGSVVAEMESLSNWGQGPDLKKNTLFIDSSFS